MIIKTNGKEIEIFEDVGAGAITVFDGCVKSKLDSLRVGAVALKSGASVLNDPEMKKNTLDGMRILADQISEMDIIDLTWDEWFSVFACQSKPIMTVEDFNRWSNMAEVDDCKKKLLQAFNPSSRLESHLRRLGLLETIYSNRKSKTP